MESRDVSATAHTYTEACPGHHGLTEKCPTTEEYYGDERLLQVGQTLEGVEIRGVPLLDDPQPR